LPIKGKLLWQWAAGNIRFAARLADGITIGSCTTIN
jgi:hypothetical protein